MHPVLFRVGDVPVHSYGTMLAIGFLVGIALLHRHARFTPELKPDRIIDVSLFVLVGSLIGARVMYVLLNLGQFKAPLEMLYVNRGGLSFHGGLLGALLGGLLFSRFYKVPFWRMADQFMPSLAIGYAITKVGCFLNGCCIGRPTGTDWGVRFPDPFVAGALTLPSHPAQLYDAAANVLMCFAMASVLYRKRFHGQVFLSYLVAYSAIRFVIEGFRKGVSAKVMLAGASSPVSELPPSLFGWPFTQAQWASLAIAALSAAILVWQLRKAPKERLPIPPIPVAAAGGPPSGPSVKKKPKRRGRSAPAPKR